MLVAKMKIVNVTMLLCYYVTIKFFLGSTKKDLQIFAIPPINANFATDFIRKLAVGYCPRLL